MVGKGLKCVVCMYVHVCIGRAALVSVKMSCTGVGDEKPSVYAKVESAPRKWEGRGGGAQSPKVSRHKLFCVHAATGSGVYCTLHGTM